MGVGLHCTTGGSQSPDSGLLHISLAISRRSQQLSNDSVCELPTVHTFETVVATSYFCSSKLKLNTRAQ